MEPTREETRLLRYALRSLAALAGEHLSAFDEIALGIDATFDAHLQRISQLETRLTLVNERLDHAHMTIGELRYEIEHLRGAAL
jgi:hypothetical protein